MCGIIGVTGTGPAVPRLIDSLKRLEYRGYDSAGVAALVDGRIERRRAKGKIRELEAVLAAQPLEATVGIGHTRWAIHGAPTTENAHPHKAGRVTLVHNGIIENFAELKAELVAEGHAFESQTDTEVVAHLLDSELAKSNDPLAAFKSVLDRLTGAYALAVLIEGEDGLILGARRGSPLVVGWGDGEMYLGSDALAVGPFTTRISYLEEGDFVALDRDGARMFDASGAAAFTGFLDRAHKLGIRVVLSGLQPQPRAVLARMHALDHPAIAADLGGFDEAVPAARGLVGRD